MTLAQPTPPDSPGASPVYTPAAAPATGAGSLFVVMAPSGTGKTTLVRALLQARPGMELSVSYTTRAPRDGERNGVDYHFVDRPEFERRRDAGEFVEWAEVHGNLYGTSRNWLAQRMAQGHDIVLEIDCQGARQVAVLFPDAITIFIAPPSVQALRERLEGRGKDSAEVIERRIRAAHDELKQAHRFQYVIINQDFATALAQLASIVDAAGLRFAKQQARAPALFARLFASA